tara:strand:+ start:238 stop:1317 length:1080 start_codon:yes stop_codon:yes gene_type:complete
MKEREFSNIFIKPLYGIKTDLNNIDVSIYKEVIDLSDRFCMPHQILHNLKYDQGMNNSLIEALEEQIYVSNLKSLINQKEILKISKLFNQHEIDYVFMKGSAINTLGNGYVRYARDLDILVSKNQLSESYQLLKEIGYRYHNKLVSDRSRFTKYSHHLPILSNDDGSLVEIHHRVTAHATYRDCPLTALMLNQYDVEIRNGVNIKISCLNHLIAHIIYHAVEQHKYDMGPVFLYDIKYLTEKLNDENNLKRLLQKMYLDEPYEVILGYINEKKIADSFSIYDMSNEKELIKRKPKSFSYLLFTKKGRSNFYQIILRKFTKNEDLYQTSRYSIKFYIILLVEFKSYCMRLLKANGRDGRI